MCTLRIAVVMTAASSAVPSGVTRPEATRKPPPSSPRPARRTVGSPGRRPSCSKKPASGRGPVACRSGGEKRAGTSFCSPWPMKRSPGTSLRIKSAVFTLNPLLADYLQAQTSVSGTRIPARADCNTSVVAYDEELAQRIRALVADEAGVSEKKMFGGLAFLLGGNMAVAASGQGGLLARVDPAESDRLVQETPAEEMVMRGRAMAGWLRLDSAD